MDINGPLRRFITDETSQKDPQDALKLTKRYKSTHNIEPSKRFETDKTSQKNPQDALKLMKHLERTFKML
ncbi:hypothetical protein RhiirB3_448150 [Rhizophagus irregularis]|nr:hypothetical protein RhiirB3_448150 [Rhizophagus irregularis]